MTRDWSSDVCSSDLYEIGGQMTRDWSSDVCSSDLVNKEQKREDFNYDYCKGCGICANVCPFDAIEMKDI